jgi:hypothetical protein
MEELRDIEERSARLKQQLDERESLKESGDLNAVNDDIEVIFEESENLSQMIGQMDERTDLPQEIKNRVGEQKGNIEAVLKIATEEYYTTYYEGWSDGDSLYECEFD